MNSRRQSSMSYNSSKLSMNEPDRGKKTNCEICGEKFNVLHREHVCKRCLRSICSGCGKQKKKILGYENQPDKEHRICTPCKKESDKLDDMKKDYGMVFGKDSKIVPTWLNTMGIQNWPEIEEKFGEMVTKAAKLTNLPPFKALQLSLNVQSYNSNFFTNYSFVEMMCLTQAEVSQKVHQTIKDTLGVFLYKYHDTVGFSEDLLNLAVFLLCFSSPAKVFCLLEAIYSGKIIPTHLFPIRDDEFQVNGNPQKKQVNDQILKILKEKFKCESGILNKTQKFLEELGSNCIESLLIGKLNFDCCFSLFDTLMTWNGSKYTQLVKEVATVLFVNREIICGKPGEVGFDLWKEILNRTQKEEVFLQMKWELTELIIPVYEDKTKAIVSLNKQLSEKESDLKNIINERESLKKELAKNKSDAEQAEKQAREAERVSSDQISKLTAKVNELEDLLVKQREENEVISDRNKSSMETSIAALQIKNKQLEESRDQSKVKANGLEIDLTQLKLKYESDKKQHTDEEAIQKQKNMSYEKIIAQLHEDINAAKVLREQLDGQLRVAEEKLNSSQKTIDELTVLKEKDQKFQDNIDQLKAVNKDLEQKLKESEATLKVNIENLENEKKTIINLQSKHAEELAESERKSTALEELLTHKSITSAQVLKDKESAFSQELKQKDDMFAQSLKEITKLKQETVQLSTENNILKQYKKENEGMKEQEHNKSIEVCKALNDTISSKNALIGHLEEQLVQIKQTVVDVSSAKDQIEKEKQAKLQESEDVLRQLKDGQIENQAQKVQLEKKCSEIESLNTKVEDISRQLSECQLELEKQLKNEVLNKQLEDNKEQQQKLEGEIEKLSEELKQCHSKIEEGLGIKEQLTAELEKVKSQLDVLSSQDGDKQTAIENQQKQIETLKEQLKSLTEEGTVKDVKITEIEQKLKEFNEEKQKLLGQITGLEHEKISLGQQLSEGEKKVELLEETNSRCETQLKSYQSEISELREQLDKEEKSLVERDSQLSQLRDETIANQETMEQLIEDLKKQLLDSQNNHQETTHKCEEQHKQIEKLHRQLEFEEQSKNQLQIQLNASSDKADQNETQMKLQVDLQELQKKHFELEGKLNEATEEVSQAVSERNTINEQLKKAQDELKQLQNDVSAAKKLIALKDKEIVVKQTELMNVQRQLQDAHHNAGTEQEQKTKEILELKGKISENLSEIKTLQMEIDNYHKQKTIANDEISRLNKEQEDKEKAFNESKAEALRIYEERNQKYQVESQDSKINIDKYVNENKQLIEQQVQLKQENQQLQKHLDEIKLTQEESSETIKSINGLIHTANQEIIQGKNREEELQKQGTALESQISKSKEELLSQQQLFKETQASGMLKYEQLQAETTQKSEEYQKQLRELQETIGKLNQNANDIQSTLNEKENNIIKLQKQIAEHDKEKLAILVELSESQVECQELSKANRSCTQKIIDQENQNENLSQQIISLKQQIDIINKEKEKSKKSDKDTKKKDVEQAKDSGQMLELKNECEALKQQVKLQTSALNKLADLEERIQLKTEENLILQQMIRQVAPVQDVSRSTHQEKDLKEKAQKLSRILAVRYLLKNKQIKDEQGKNKNVVEQLTNQIVQLADMNGKVISQHNQFVSDQSKFKISIEAKDEEIESLNTEYREKIIALTQENAELLGQLKQKQAQVDVSSGQLKQTLMKLLLIQIEFNRVTQLISSK